MSAISFPLAILTLNLILVISGCGGSNSDLREVTGKVTLDDRPLSGASVDFYPVGEGSSASGFTDENGEYQLSFSASEEGAPIGEYTVSISKERDEEDDEGDNDPDEGDIETLPHRYNEDTELTAKVTADGPNQFNFPLVSGN